AVVNGSYISMREYQSTYNNLIEQMRRQFGRQFSTQLVESLGLKEQALDRLINRTLLLEEAGVLGLEITQGELQDAIRAYPAFQSNGQFDPRRYQQALRYLRLTPQEFELSQHDDLLISKVERFITRGAKVLEAEVRSFYHHIKDKVNLKYILVEPGEFADKVEENEEALERYFNEHREEYRLVAKRQIIYVRFAPRDYVDAVELDDEEVQEYYQLHEDNYQEPKKVRARHILFKIPQGTTPSEEQAIEARAKEALTLVKNGDDFADLARKYSQDSTASKGGDLGYFARADMVEPFADTAFSLEKGEISELVRTRFGLHIIKVEDIQEASTQPFVEVEEAVRQALKTERAREIARERAETFADESRAQDDLRKAATDKDLQVTESGLFAVNEPILELGYHPELNEQIFALQLKEVSPGLSVGEDHVVTQLVEIQDSRLPELKEVKDAAKQNWIAEQSKILARKQAEEWLETSLQEGDLSQVASRNDLDIKETGLFTSVAPAPSLGNQRGVLVTAFALTAERPVAPEVYEVNGNFIIFQMKARDPAPEDQFQKEQGTLDRQLLRVKKQEAFTRWMSARREQSDIRILQEL
ncbi:MAG: SurA N-terminal domain-containing protein, partial [Deltaproteobacteria bacterium]